MDFPAKLAILQVVAGTFSVKTGKLEKERRQYPTFLPLKMGDGTKAHRQNPFAP